jgi:hypothetical protein
MKVCGNKRCCGIEKEDELQWGEENALNLNYGVEKPQDIKNLETYRKKETKPKLGQDLLGRRTRRLLPGAKR